jgi:predicted XRE-type DNA-binding protein
VLHAFQKKSPKTSRSDLKLASRRYRIAHDFRKEHSVARKVTESTGNIFLDMGFPPHEAEVMLLRAKLAEALRVWMEREKLTQAEAAKRLGITQPRVSEIVRGKVELLSLDYLVALCAKARIPVGVRVAA